MRILLQPIYYTTPLKWITEQVVVDFLYFQLATAGKNIPVIAMMRPCGSMQEVVRAAVVARLWVASLTSRSCLTNCTPATPNLPTTGRDSKRRPLQPRPVAQAFPWTILSLIAIHIENRIVLVLWTIIVLACAAIGTTVRGVVLLAA
jgi:hypothetical protein